MKKINLEQLRQQISIVDVIGSYIKLSKKGNNYIGLCPFHNDQHASLTVNENKKIYKCFSCNAAGDVFKFVKNYDNLNLEQAIIKCCEVCNLTNLLSEEFKQQLSQTSADDKFFKMNELANKYFMMFLDNKENLIAKKYLESRHIDQELIKKFNIGFAPNNKTILIDLLSNKDDMVRTNVAYSLEEIKQGGLALINHQGTFESYFTNRITFAIFDQFNHIVGFSARTINNDSTKYLNSPTTKIFNKSHILYNIQNVINNDPETIYLLEGFMDVIALSKIGINDALATMGVAFSKDHLKVLEQFNNLKNIVLCFDNDTAGQEAIKKTSELLKDKYNLYVVDFDSKYKDFDELVNNDKELAINTVNNLIHYDSHLIDQLLLKKNSIVNKADKDNLLNKILLILKNINNDFVLLENINKVAKNLDIESDLILASINYAKKTNTRKFQRNNSRKFETKDSISLREDKPIKKVKIDALKTSELEVIKFSLYNKEYVNVFVKSGLSLTDSFYKNILNKIIDIYFNNKDINNLIDLDNDKIKTIIDIQFEQKEQALLLTLINTINRQKLSYTLKQVNEIIKVYQKRIIDKEKMELFKKYKEQKITDQELALLLNELNKRSKL